MEPRPPHPPYYSPVPRWRLRPLQGMEAGILDWDVLPERDLHYTSPVYRGRCQGERREGRAGAGTLQFQRDHPSKIAGLLSSPVNVVPLRCKMAAVFATFLPEEVM
ncbi:hypothetical protein NDU88_012727 [Pleurodeles waltl]|uniref:Uncharacterized protein n=1 Tax=Pleurodeles waltl TaxID=8319 RepID=A0AAV7R2R2_PLEWA|nr:hypothetical protein NDU88_012727 [Pleurodeles waltl]